VKKEIFKWVKPSVGWYKLNVDSALNARTGRPGFCIVARDSDGKVRAAKSLRKLGLVEPAAAETLFKQEAGMQASFGQKVDDVLLILDSFPKWQIHHHNPCLNRSGN
jgi:hypothetical protein